MSARAHFRLISMPCWGQMLYTLHMLRMLTITATVLLITTAAHAGVDVKHGRCYSSDKVRYSCSILYGKNWRKIFKDWIKNNPDTWWYSLPPSPDDDRCVAQNDPSVCNTGVRYPLPGKWDTPEYWKHNPAALPCVEGQPEYECRKNEKSKSARISGLSVCRAVDSCSAGLIHGCRTIRIEYIGHA